MGQECNMELEMELNVGLEHRTGTWDWNSTGTSDWKLDCNVGLAWTRLAKLL